MWIFSVLMLLMVGHACAVVELNDNNFYAYAQAKDVLLVNFYAPWCSDCTKLAPEFEGAGSALGPRSADLAKVDCFGDGKGICQMYSVNSWPQMKNFHHGTYTGDYTGEQNSAAIANYINTVENSREPDPQVAATNTNPYAMAYPATQMSAAVQQHPAAVAATPILCAKCTIEKPHGKLSDKCTKALKKQCIVKTQRLTAAQTKYGVDD